MIQKENILKYQNNSISVLLNLKKFSIPCETAMIGREKIGLQQNQSFELDSFKKEIIGGKIANHQAYLANSNKVRQYRTIFFSLAILFFALTACTYFQNISFSSIIFGDLRLIIKGIVCSFSTILAIIALGIGYSLCIAKEASAQIANKAKRRLIQIYAQKRLENGISGLFFNSDSYTKHIILKQTYQKALEKINEKREQIFYLLKKIQNSDVIDEKKKELLFNQAITEMNHYTKEVLNKMISG